MDRRSSKPTVGAAMHGGCDGGAASSEREAHGRSCSRPASETIGCRGKITWAKGRTTGPYSCCDRLNNP